MLPAGGHSYRQIEREVVVTASGKKGVSAGKGLPGDEVPPGTASLCQQKQERKAPETVTWLSLAMCLDMGQEHLGCQHKQLGLRDLSVQISTLIHRL